MVLILSGGQDGFHPSCQDTPWEQNLAPTAQALKADIGAQADNFPFIATARMRLAQGLPVVEVQVGQHRGHFNIRMQLKWSDPVCGVPVAELPES
jgi:hypothetical protein